MHNLLDRIELNLKKNAMSNFQDSTEDSLEVQNGNLKKISLLYIIMYLSRRFSY